MIYYCYSFFFNDTATTEIYTLSLHDALPIYYRPPPRRGRKMVFREREDGYAVLRSEERFSRNAETDLVCRPLLEKKKTGPRNPSPAWIDPFVHVLVTMPTMPYMWSTRALRTA